LVSVPVMFPARPLFRGTRPPVRRGLAVGSLALGTLALLLVASASAGGPTSPWSPTSSPGWSNGEVRCLFDPRLPSVNVSDPNVEGSGLVAALSDVAELAPDGSVAAVASAGAGNWSVQNGTDPAVYELLYRAALPIQAPGGRATFGNATVGMDVRLATESASAQDRGFAEVALNVSEWPWRSGGDRLRFDLTLGTVSDESLAAAEEGGVSLVDDGSGTPRLYLATGTEANTTSATGTGTAVPVIPAVRSGPTGGSVELLVNSTEPVRSIELGLRIGVYPANLAGLPAWEYASVGALAAAVCVAVAVGTLRVRRRPSRLIYAEGPP
jgi:hypothetical protein